MYKMEPTGINKRQWALKKRPTLGFYDVKDQAFSEEWKGKRIVEKTAGKKSKLILPKPTGHGSDVRARNEELAPLAYYSETPQQGRTPVRIGLVVFHSRRTSTI
ncbi:hypothetical protein ES332_A07G221500v1 [Gossypium tomentosum]|uniref:Uncharacterized protein n=1 Tax=Gossypium tomentosum TaxID=34277 RepID=A0A5D2PW32_GOSTO|nr:hypothetical protein ES332_A07G221500v1 [Gossypium tomentosum]